MSERQCAIWHDKKFLLRNFCDFLPASCLWSIEQLISVNFGGKIILQYAQITKIFHIWPLYSLLFTFYHLVFRLGRSGNSIINENPGKCLCAHLDSPHICDGGSFITLNSIYCLKKLRDFKSMFWWLSFYWQVFPFLLPSIFIADVVKPRPLNINFVPYR